MPRAPARRSPFARCPSADEPIGACAHSSIHMESALPWRRSGSAPARMPGDEAGTTMAGPNRHRQTTGKAEPIHAASVEARWLPAPPPASRRCTSLRGRRAQWTRRQSRRLPPPLQPPTLTSVLDREAIRSCNPESLGSAWIRRACARDEPTARIREGCWTSRGSSRGGLGRADAQTLALDGQGGPRIMDRHSVLTPGRRASAAATNPTTRIDAQAMRTTAREVFTVRPPALARHAILKNCLARTSPRWRRVTGNRSVPCPHAGRRSPPPRPSRPEQAQAHTDHGRIRRGRPQACRVGGNGQEGPAQFARMPARAATATRSRRSSNSSSTIPIGAWPGF